METTGSRTYQVYLVENLTNEKMELLGINLIMTFEPENVKAILTTQFGDFAKGEIFHKSWHQVFSPSLFV
jgi:hypothetical protein